MITKIRYVLFDVEGTLLSRGYIAQIIRQVLEGYGYATQLHAIQTTHIKLRETIEFPVHTDRQFYSSFNKRLLQELSIPATERLINAIYDAIRSIPYSQYPDTSILRSLTVPTGIISNWDDTLRDILNVYFGDFIFDPIIASYEFGVSKPDVRLFTIALSRLAMPPESVLYIGNSPEFDMVPALKSGMQTLLIDRENMFPYYTGNKINSLNELAKIFI